jgi:hypothetical protein
MDASHADSLPRLGVLCFDPLCQIAEAWLEEQQRAQGFMRKPYKTPGDQNECR